MNFLINFLESLFSSSSNKSKGVGSITTTTLYDKENMSDIATKGKKTAILLAFFLGWLGIDRFYLGYAGMGIIKVSLFFFRIILSSQNNVVSEILAVIMSIALTILCISDFIRIIIGKLNPKYGIYY